MSNDSLFDVGIDGIVNIQKSVFCTGRLNGIYFMDEIKTVYYDCRYLCSKALVVILTINRGSIVLELKCTSDTETINIELLASAIDNYVYILYIVLKYIIFVSVAQFIHYCSVIVTKNTLSNIFRSF